MLLGEALTSQDKPESVNYPIVTHGLASVNHLMNKNRVKTVGSENTKEIKEIKDFKKDISGYERYGYDRYLLQSVMNRYAKDAWYN